MTTLLHRSRAALAPALLAALLLGGCGPKDDAPPSDAPAPRTVPVQTVALAPTQFSEVVELSGAVEAQNDAMLSAQSAGTVTYIAERGASVGAGQTVAQLNPAVVRAGVQQAEAGVQAAQAQYALAEDNFNRQQPLYRDSIISAIEFEGARAQINQARASLAQARAVLAQAQEQLRNTRVVAPFSGVIEERMVEKGEQVLPGQQVVRIVSNSQLKVAAAVPERFAGEVAVGREVQIGFEAYGGEKRTGRITFVGRAVNPANRTFPVDIAFTDPGQKFKPQMVVNVYLPLNTLDGVLVAPTDALLQDGENTVAFVAEQRGGATVAARRVVVAGAASGGETVVLSGLKPGEALIVEGQSRLADGDPVQASPRPAEQTVSLSGAP